MSHHCFIEIKQTSSVHNLTLAFKSKCSANVTRCCKSREHRLTVHLVRLQSRHQVPVHLHKWLFGLLILIQDQLGGDGAGHLGQLILNNNYLENNGRQSQPACTHTLHKKHFLKGVCKFSTSLLSSICCSLSARRLHLSSSSLRASWVSARRFTSSMILRIFLRPLGVP